MKAALALLGILSSALVAGQALPGVLIVQTDDKAEIVAAAKATAEKAPRPNPLQPQLAPPRFDAEKFAASLTPVALEDIAAQEFDDDGRLTPIAWSMGDPVFRTAVEERLIPAATESPSESEMRTAMGKLKAGYLFVVQAFAAEGQVWTQARLFRGTKEIWKDEVRFWQSNVRNQFDEENARRSIVRTWIQVLGSSTLKDMPQRKRISTPPVDPGQTTPNPPVVPNRPGVDNKQLLVDVMKLLSQKQFGEAINLMRDAVDSEPLDFERRDTLVSTLVQAGQPALAAEEARRAAHLMPERIEFWIAAARAWLAADRPDEALKDLNEAVVRDAESPATRLLLGELQVADRKFELGIESLTKALERVESASALRLRAFAYAALGRSAEARQDLEAAGKIDVKESEAEALRRYRLCQSATTAHGDGLAAEVRTMIQQTRLDSKDPELKRSLDEMAARLGSLTEVFAPAPPEAHRNSHERLLLALNLLNQTVTRLRGVLEKPDEDALTDAAIDLGEAIKALESARQARRSEAA